MNSQRRVDRLHAIEMGLWSVAVRHLPTAHTMGRSFSKGDYIEKAGNYFEIESGTDSHQSKEDATRESIERSAVGKMQRKTAKMRKLLQV